MKSLHAAAIQICAHDNLEDNLKRCEVLIAQAAAQGAELIALPENFAYLGTGDAHHHTIAEVFEAGQAAGIIGQWLSDQARKHAIHLVAGGVLERAQDKLYNSALYYDAAGQLCGRYRKMHLFNVTLADGTALYESKNISAGEAVCVIETPFGRMGLAICYDIRFPELFRAMANVDFLVLGAAFTLHTGRDHWLTLLAARAIENQIYIIAPAQWGKHHATRASFGKSAIVDPWGTLLAVAPDRDTFVLAQLESEWLEQVRKQLPALEHRKLMFTAE